MSTLNNRAAVLRRLGGRVLDLLLPPQCLNCGEPVAAPGTLCPECWPQLQFLAPPHCAACGFPFEFAYDDESLCLACIRTSPTFDRARSVMRYDDVSRNMILRFKHADQTEGAPAYGRWLARAGAELTADADVIVPIPLHWTRLFARRYNQSALLALALGRLTRRKVAPDLLVRRRRTPSQGGLSATARDRNVRGAFAIANGRGPEVSDRRVLLVDDVFTTGATVGECARVLRRAGAAGVDVVTLARVVRPQR